MQVNSIPFNGYFFFSTTDINQQFIDAYIRGDEKAAAYLDHPQLDVNYQEGLFLLKAAENGDLPALEKMLKKGATDGLNRALSAAAYEGYEDCVELLIEHGADPKHLRGTTAFNRYEYIENLLKEKIAEQVS